jgi:hypothetical protein
MLKKFQHDGDIVKVLIFDYGLRFALVHEMLPCRGYPPRYGARGDEKLIAATASCLMSDKREQNMPGDDERLRR